MSHSTARRRGAACRAIAAGLLLLSGLAGCATPPANPAARAAFEETDDPLEPLNRKIFAVNQVIDTILLKPAAEVYVSVFPKIGRDALRHMLDNLKEPVIAINDTLQFEPKRTGITLGRFVVNSTVGIGGALDVATKWGLQKQTGDFGQTLYVWGVKRSPYLVLPILGPSNPRDAVGLGMDAYIDPFAYFATAADADQLEIARFVLDGIDQRARVLDQLDQLQKNSLDFYAQLRSLVQQKRAAELQRGAAPPTPENFYNVPNKAAPPAPGSTRS
ncbi:MAG TPA: VacJ family lipoprotein [Stellaceae bacterium]|nr:VacJ family lipoprotein [Stellaceae bacterium]